MKEASSSSSNLTKLSPANFLKALLVVLILLILGIIIEKCTPPESCCETKICAPDPQPFRKGQYILEFERRISDTLRDSLRTIVYDLFEAHDSVKSLNVIGIDTCLCTIPIEKIYLDINGEGIEDVVVASTGEAFEGEADILDSIIDSLNAHGLKHIDKVWVFEMESSPDWQVKVPNLSERIFHEPSPGQSDIVVAIIDNGIHPQLFENYLNQKVIWRNGQEGGDDDDENCLEDDFVGWNFALNNNDIYNNNLHGSFVSEVFKQRYESYMPSANGLKFMTLKISDEEGKCDVFGATCALHYAASKGANVVNSSWGLYVECGVITEAVGELHSRDIIMTSSLGNNRINLDSEDVIHIPSDLNYQTVLGIGGLSAGASSVWGHQPCQCRNAEGVLNLGSNYYNESCNLFDIAVYELEFGQISSVPSAIEVGLNTVFPIKGTSYAAPAVGGFIAAAKASGLPSDDLYRNRLCTGAGLSSPPVSLSTRLCEEKIEVIDMSNIDLP